MTAPVDISLTVNGEPVEARVLPRTHLADFLREELGLTGTHTGCEQGVCGACTVRLDGEIVRGCLVLAVQAQGASVETIEGLSDTGEIADLQGVFQERNALQCGFCTPGMLIAAQDLLAREPDPSRDAIREHLSGNYCRCTGYQAIVDAVETAAKRRRESKPMSDDPQPGLSVLDRPNSYIGRSVPRPNLARLVQGRGQYVSDMVLPRMGHVAFVRSPHAHARILGIDASAAKTAPGVIAVVTGAELAKVCTPWVGVLSHLKGLKSAPQHAIALDRACWQGEAVAAVVARTRAAAEDAAEKVEVAYEELEPVTDMATALDAGTPVIHPELGDNLAFERQPRRRRGRPRLRRSRCRRRGELRLRPPHRRDARAARHGRRLEPRRGPPDRLPGHPGASHDAEHHRQAPRPRRGAGAGGVQGRRRLVRHQGARLCRRDGDGGAVEAACAGR